MKGRWLLITLAIFILLPALPVYGYGDPSGGLFFQVLMPTLAAIWGMWMVFANSIRRRVGNLFRRLRGTSVNEDGGSSS